MPTINDVLREYKHSTKSARRRAIIESAMATQKFMLAEYPWHERYRVTTIDDVLTPALLLYPEIITSNIVRTLHLLGGNADRWRPHLKTAKLAYTLRMLLDRGVHNFKCATTLELLTACRAGAGDVLVAYPVMGANARRVREIADQFPSVRISALAENDLQVQQWVGSRIGLFLDINPGMNRTGIEISETERIVALIRAMNRTGLKFRGLHYYDGQYGSWEQVERITAAHAGYDRLLQLVSEIQRSGSHIPEIITAGTPTFPASLTYDGFHSEDFLHRVSPGTLVYNDAVSLSQLSADFGYAPAAVVLTRVVSAPHQGRITCDAGHKSVSADAGVPTCLVVGHPELTPLSPSEEHLPLETNGGKTPLTVGDALYLLPRHICPTVNNFDSALLVKNGEIQAIEPVTARGRERPLLRNLEELASELSPAIPQKF
jgi:D-serine deaminase-like pyridoxal phosphate-dependent protein